MQNWYFFQSLSTAQNNKCFFFFCLFLLEPVFHLKALFWGAHSKRGGFFISQFLHSATVIFTISLARARFLSPWLAPQPTFNLLPSSKVCYKGSLPPCLTSDEFLWLSFWPTSLPTCPQGGHIWWDCSCLILLPSLWSVINFLLNPSLPVLPSLFQSPILKPPKVFFKFFSFLKLNPTLWAFLVDSIPSSSPSFLPCVDLFTCMHPKKAEAESFQYTRLASTCKLDLSSRRTEAAREGLPSTHNHSTHQWTIRGQRGIAAAGSALACSHSPTFKCGVEERLRVWWHFGRLRAALSGHKRRHYGASRLTLAR